MLEGRTITLRLFTDDDLEEHVEAENVYAEQTEHLPPAFRSLASRQ
jgi:hypothetical protein